MKDPEFKYSDLHCHPNLKSYGHSFDSGKSSHRSDAWFGRPPTFFAKLLNVLLGLTRFNQSDLTTMSRGGANLVFVSLYPFEKGFFINAAGRGGFSAYLSNLITGIGFNRIRDIQTHGDYFADLEKEYSHFLENKRQIYVGGDEKRWRPVESESDLKEGIEKAKEILVCFSIEGAHVFNTGLGPFGRTTKETEVLENVRKVKNWKYPPVYITFAHNFFNDLCGHARSLEPIEKFVDQSQGLDTGFTPLGYRVLDELLSNKNGRPILVDLKHMSLRSRKEYFDHVTRGAKENLPPTLVSHGAVNGMTWGEGKSKYPDRSEDFYRSDINFYDEEIELIGASGGLFAVQFDARRIARFDLVKKNWGDLFGEDDMQRAVNAIWLQLKHIAIVLDQNRLFSWGTTCIGSDYDGTIDPLPGVWTAAQFPGLSDGIQRKAEEFLKGPNPIRQERNKSITSKEIADRFFFQNTVEFLQRYYQL